ncbi:hypothetical protein SAMN02583745_01796 [Thorsellia anophelis DSM 18579]|uniref:Uncharacterized protein n=2 Tax=Thorsellia anophelis TaxID=336804 RepID=A0A1I0CZQ6_9GAMM|nr:hypothetical protein SAMN02583745_01796 [Thorsellia anophelis DSM 18579]
MVDINTQENTHTIILNHRYKKAKKQFIKIRNKYAKSNSMDNQTLHHLIFKSAKLRLSIIINRQSLSFLCFVFNLIFLSIWFSDNSIMQDQKELMPAIAIVDYVELLDYFYETLSENEIETHLLNVKARLESLTEQGIIILDASLIHGAPRDYYLPIHWLVQPYLN